MNVLNCVFLVGALLSHLANVPHYWYHTREDHVISPDVEKRCCKLLIRLHWENPAIYIAMFFWRLSDKGRSARIDTAAGNGRNVVQGKKHSGYRLGRLYRKRLPGHSFCKRKDLDTGLCF